MIYSMVEYTAAIIELLFGVEAVNVIVDCYVFLQLNGLIHVCELVI